MAKEFINPAVEKSIGTVAGTAYYLKTEIEDDMGRWNDNYYTRDGYWVIHEGKQHHVYKIPAKRPMTHKELLENKGVSSGVRSPNIAGGKYKFPKGKGKGWHEPTGSDGKAPRHKEVAERAQAKHAQNKPMRRGELGSPSDQTAIIRTLKENQKTHRKLTEKERDRMIDMWASAPLDYKPEIDDGLIKLGLAQFWDNMPDAVENTDMPFYADNGGILPEWYDFKAETARYDAQRAAFKGKANGANNRQMMKNKDDVTCQYCGATMFWDKDAGTYICTGCGKIADVER